MGQVATRLGTSQDTSKLNIEETIESVPLHQLFSAKRKANSERLAAGDGKVKISYGSLDVAIDLMASKLITAGVQTGDRVSLMGPPGLEFLITYLATVSIGGVWLGLNPKYTTSELKHIIDDSEPRVILESSALNNAQRRSLQVSAPVPPIPFESFLGMPVSGLVGLSKINIDPAVEARRDELQVSAPAALFYTSGTTGKPKGAIARAAALARIGLKQSEEWDGPHPSTVANLPINHTGCVGDIVTVSQFAGGYLRFIDGFDIDETITAIIDDEVDTLFQIPTQLISLSKHPDFADIARKQLKNIGWGGASLPEELVEMFATLGPRLSTVYGSSETVASISTAPSDATIEQLASTVGIPDPVFDMHLLTQDGQSVPFSKAQGQTGEILVKHWTFLPEYLNNPVATRETFTDEGYLKTGDIGYVRQDGYLALVGRTKEVFKSGGYNVYPKEVEIALERHPDVQEAAVVHRSDPKFSEVGVAFVKATDGVTKPLESFIEKLRIHCRALIANYKVPKDFVIVSDLPRLPNGKIDNVSLGTQAEQLKQKGNSSHD